MLMPVLTSRHMCQDILMICDLSAELALAAGQMRQAVADTFVSLADSWELGKKFSGVHPNTLDTSHLLRGGDMLLSLIRVFDCFRALCHITCPSTVWC